MAVLAFWLPQTKRDNQREREKMAVKRERKRERERERQRKSERQRMAVLVFWLPQRKRYNKRERERKNGGHCVFKKVKSVKFNFVLQKNREERETNKEMVVDSSLFGFSMSRQRARKSERDREK